MDGVQLFLYGYKSVTLYFQFQTQLSTLLLLNFGFAERAPPFILIKYAALWVIVFSY